MGINYIDLEASAAAGNRDSQRLLKRINAALGEPTEDRTKPNPEYQPIPKKKRLRQSSGPLLNNLESDFFAQWTLEHSEGCLEKQAIRFRLANGLWYKPDFVWLQHDPIIAYEVKGPKAFRGGFENLKFAAATYPAILWVMCWKEENRWFDQRVLP